MMALDSLAENTRPEDCCICCPELLCGLEVEGPTEDDATPEGELGGTPGIGAVQGTLRLGVEGASKKAAWPKG